MTAAELLLGTVVLVGASVQRVTGIGFALVTAPALALLVGPGQGVLVSNCAAGAISAVGLCGGWRRVRVSAMVPLVLAAACTVPAGAWVADRLPERVLLTAIGLTVTAAVLLVIGGVRVAALRGRAGAVVAGAASGFLNSSAGVGGPALSLYAVNARWPVREFVPNAQFYGVLVNLFSIAAKGLPALAAPGWLLVASGVAGGAVLGRLLGDRLSERQARRLVLGLALLGALATLAKGVLG
ncbi:sulfite exporter TauE/SafE family protein [Peterkaempfera bronchialis]|uniref:Probable membrane transporter protein n=1 Tax=Peterkaempfera bronchialis TaxID=2126346 RepID=A0A345SRV0_9ACTN|nr:sulfite exporter TauE/SafE family protein [Peterkaempfera bronchialis]AXI76455.1 sulfite exporter TauE/SafE family protein [Peterkaempfera bronchialis]